MKDPKTREIISRIKACKLMKDCPDGCHLPKCVEDYKGTIDTRREAVVNDARIELISELYEKGWTVYGICELIKSSEKLVEIAIKGRPIGRVLLKGGRNGS